MAEDKLHDLSPLARGEDKVPESDERVGSPATNCSKRALVLVRAGRLHREERKRQGLSCPLRFFPEQVQGRVIRPNEPKNSDTRGSREGLFEDF